MAIANPLAAVDGISNWIKDKVAEARAKTAVVGVSGGADSALVAILCKLKTPTIGVIMPCHSSPGGIARARELLEKFKIFSLDVNLDEAYKAISSQVDEGMGKAATLQDHKPANLDRGALRSCLRAPTLDYVSKLANGIIVGTGNRDEDEMTRYFQKRGDGCVDISPIAKLHKSEVYELLRFLDCPKSIIDAPPSADLWGPDSGQEDEKELKMTYKEVEWGVRELQDKRYSEALRREINGTFLSDVLQHRGPYNHPGLAAYTDRQIEVLFTLDQMERDSRHKARAPEVFDVRSVPGLIG